MNKLFGIIFGDNFYEKPRTAISRSTGMHRVATLLRKRDVVVEAVDFFNSWTEEELISFVSKFPVIDFIGLSLGLSTLDRDKIVKLIKYLKDTHPNIKIIAGGSNVLGNQFNIDNPSSENPLDKVDMFFKGFTDGAMDDIVTFIKNGKINPFIVQTINTHDVRKVVNCTEHYPKFDLSNLQTEYIDNDFINNNESLTLETSRGCIFKCKFCSFPLIGKNKNDYIREKQDIKQELINNYKRWGITKYSITDDTFNDNEIKVDMLYEISQELDFKLNLIAYARVDLLHARPGSLDKLIKTGINGLFFGIESLNDHTSRLIGKGLTGDKLKNYLIDIKQQYPDLHITGSFVVGLPHEPADVFHANIDWTLKEKVFGSYNFYPLSIPIDNKVNYTSTFTTEWQKYGYSSMTDEEILKFVEDNSSHPQFEWLLKNTGYLFKHHSMAWKNEHMTFLDAIYNSELSKKKVAPHTSVSGWTVFAQSFNKPDIVTSLQMKRTSVDWNKQIKDAENFVNIYKSKKISITNLAVK